MSKMLQLIPILPAKHWHFDVLLSLCLHTPPFKHGISQVDCKNSIIIIITILKQYKKDS